jgi:hypothetical protein
MKRWQRGALLLLVVAGLLAGPAFAQTQEKVQQPAASDAMAIIKRMAEFLAAAPALSVTVRAGYDVVQESGQKVEFGDLVTYTLKRPDRFRVDGQKSSGEKGFILFDGKEIIAMGAGAKVYAATSKPGTIQEAVPYMVSTLELEIPLALLFVGSSGPDMLEGVESADYVETDFLMGLPCDHIAARTETVDFQLWISQGDKPLPQRIVLTYKDEPGEPQFRGQFLEWNLKPDVSDSVFAFTPPPGVERIRFLAEVEQQLEASKAASKASGRKGGKR